MTDKKTLYQYRIKQAEETLSDAEKSLSTLGKSIKIFQKFYTVFSYRDRRATIKNW